MTRPFDVCWARIKRAHAHNEAIAREWNAIVAADLHQPILEIDAEGAGSLWIEQTLLSPSVALDIGEFLYHLRAALDACIYEAACANLNQRPPPNENSLEFPICKTPDGFKNSSWKIRPLTDEQRAIVESVQPYKAPPNLDPIYVPYNFNRTLDILNDWARIDRHRRLHVIGSWADNIEPLFYLPSGTSLRELTIRQPGFILESDYQVATFRIDGWLPGMQMQANPNMTFDIALNELPPPCHDTDTLGKRFKAMLVTVNAIVDDIAKTVGVEPPD